MLNREDAPPWINIASRARSREIPIHAITLTRTLPHSLTRQLTKNSKRPKLPPAPLPLTVSHVGLLNKAAPLHLTVNHHKLTRTSSTKLTHFRTKLCLKIPSKASLSLALMTQTGPSQKVTRLSSGQRLEGVTFPMLGLGARALGSNDLDVSQKGAAAPTASALRFTLIQGL